jgi:glycosyltransferase involved in cell wall biosynthesis
MKVLQILPELNSGGVERGTLEIARALVANGDEAVVVSNGGRLVAGLEKTGARHVSFPVHRKSVMSLLKVRALRRLFEEEKPDVVHIRSRVPGWLAWLAWRKMDPRTRPHLVSTVHGFYSINAYSKIMTCGERVIAVSDSIRTYILKNYPAVPAQNIRVIHRGVSPEEFPRGYQPDATWLAEWRGKHPHLVGKKVLLLPGRITRWKGQEDFIALVASLKKNGLAVHGLIAGDTHPKKKEYADELLKLADSLGVAGDVTFLGHRSDVREVMAVSDAVFSLSREPEAFGRVSLEAAALGRVVIGYDHGGVGEQLRVLYPQGLVPLADEKALERTCTRLLKHREVPANVAAPFTQAAMQQATLAVYREVTGGGS